MESYLSHERLLEIIALQNEVAAGALELEAVMALVARRAQEMTGAAGAVIERADGDDLVYHAGSGAGERHVGARVHGGSGLSGRCLREEKILYCPDARAGARSPACPTAVPSRNGSAPRSPGCGGTEASSPSAWPTWTASGSSTRPWATRSATRSCAPWAATSPRCEARTRRSGSGATSSGSSWWGPSSTGRRPGRRRGRWRPARTRSRRLRR